MNRARMDRTLAFKTLTKTAAKKEFWHYQAIKYMANNIYTRKWIAIVLKPPLQLPFTNRKPTGSTCPFLSLIHIIEPNIPCHYSGQRSVGPRVATPATFFRTRDHPHHDSARRRATSSPRVPVAIDSIAARLYISQLNLVPGDFRPTARHWS